MAKEFVGLALAPEGVKPLEPSWTTPNTIALELKSVRLRDFSAGQAQPPALVCAPFALHGATVADFAPDHSLVAALLLSGVQRVFVTDWRSADSDMRFFSIDTYLADLNVLVDHIGGSVDLIGLCQGGWMALVYAARFPGKVRKLVLAGAPIDIAAGASFLSRAVQEIAPETFAELVDMGGGRMLGRHALQLWAPGPLGTEAVRQILASPHPAASPVCRKLEARFQNWYGWTVDLPGTYYLEVAEKLFRQNQLATGHFVALGETIDLTRVRHPVFLLVARDDELVAPAQIFATERLVGTRPRGLRKTVAACGHLGLFMGCTALTQVWPEVAAWLIAEDDHHAKPRRLPRASAT